MLPFGVLSKFKSRLPWLQRRRANLVAVTLPGGAFKLENLARLNDGDITHDDRGRPLFWNAATIGVTKDAIIDYANEFAEFR